MVRTLVNRLKTSYQPDHRASTVLMRPGRTSSVFGPANEERTHGEMPQVLLSKQIGLTGIEPALQ